MPFGHIRVVDGEIPPDGVTVVVEGTVVDGTVVEGTVVDGTVVEGTVVDCGTVAENGEVDGVVEGEMLGVEPTMLLPALESPKVGVEPTLLPNVLGGVPVTLVVGVVAKGEVV